MDPTTAGLGVFIVVILIGTLIELNLDSLLHICNPINPTSSTANLNYEPILSLSDRDKIEV